VRPSPVVSGSMSSWYPSVVVFLSLSNIFAPGEASSSSASCSLTVYNRWAIVSGGFLVCCCVFPVVFVLS
jgi:hypothetical protein